VRGGARPPPPAHRPEVKGWARLRAAPSWRSSARQRQVLLGSGAGSAGVDEGQARVNRSIGPWQSRWVGVGFWFLGGVGAPLRAKNRRLGGCVLSEPPPLPVLSRMLLRSVDCSAPCACVPSRSSPVPVPLRPAAVLPAMPVRARPARLSGFSACVMVCAPLRASKNRPSCF
jgi:hypothetical protein